MTRSSLGSIDPSDNSYWTVSRRPLQILLFLLPLIIAYEIALAVVLQREGGVFTNLAHKRLLEFFEVFHLSTTSGLYLGGLLIVVVLLAWHILARQPWRVDFRVTCGMVVESALLVLPLILLGQFLIEILAGDAGSGGVVASAAGSGGVPASFDSADVWTRLAISVGAGLYEELVFRMLLVAAIHTLMVDALKASEGWALTVAVVVSAAAFMFYHELDGTPVLEGAFLFLAGLYFGFLFVVRGFGVVVGVHALYDVATIVTNGS